MESGDRIVPIPTPVIAVLVLTAVFTAAVVPGGGIAGPLLAVLILAFVAPWRSFPYRLPIRVLTVLGVVLALVLAGIRLGSP